MRKYGRRLLYALAGVMLLLALFMLTCRDFLYTRVYPVFKRYEGLRIQRELDDYKLLDDGGFIIRYTDGDEASALKLRDIANEYGGCVSDFFGISREEPVEIILFPHETILKGMLRIPQDQSAMGAYAGGRINLLSPNRFVDINQDIDSFDNVFVHEYAHLAADDLARGNYPIWFTEGCALYLEYDVLGYEWGSDLMDEDLSHITVDDLTYRFASVDEYKAYRASFLIVRGLVEGYGKMNLTGMLDKLGKGVSFEQALAEVYGLNTSELQGFLKSQKND